MHGLFAALVLLLQAPAAAPAQESAEDQVRALSVWAGEINALSGEIEVAMATSSELAGLIEQVMAGELAADILRVEHEAIRSRRDALLASVRARRAALPPPPVMNLAGPTDFDAITRRLIESLEEGLAIAEARARSDDDVIAGVLSGEDFDLTPLVLAEYEVRRSAVMRVILATDSMAALLPAEHPQVSMLEAMSEGARALIALINADQAVYVDGQTSAAVRHLSGLDDHAGRMEAFAARGRGETVALRLALMAARSSQPDQAAFLTQADAVMGFYPEGFDLIEEMAGLLRQGRRELGEAADPETYYMRQDALLAAYINVEARIFDNQTRRNQMISGE